jgi:hypothetical protein
VFAKWFGRKQTPSSTPPTAGDLSGVHGVSVPPVVPQRSPQLTSSSAEFNSWTPAEPVDFGPVGLEGYAKRLDGHRHVIERAAPMKIGRAAIRPPEALMREMSRRMTECGATTVYWFWMSIAGDQSHLGLAVAPNDNVVVRRIGEAIDPLWRQFSPENPIFDILRLGSELDVTIKVCGELLVPWPSSATDTPPAS